MSAAVRLLVGLCAGRCGPALAVTVDDFDARWFHSAQGVLPYRLFIPTNYLSTSAQRFPLVLFLHGAGEKGDDNRSQLNNAEVLVFASEENQSVRPSFVVAPQCPAGNDWTGVEVRVLGMVNALKSEFNLDTNRLYITGLSMGGQGTWYYITRNPGTFAAAVPICGPGGLASVASKMTAIWNFHAADDPVVSVGDSIALINIVRRTGGNPIYTQYASGGHGSWIPAYATPVLMDWVYAQRRGVVPTNEPLLTVTSPTTEAVWRTGATHLNLTGTAGALGEAITLVSWNNYANNVKGLATGTNVWSITGIPLVANKTNVVAVVATTTSWAPDYGGVTTFNDTLSVACYPILTTLISQGTNALLNWTGGGPPYCVQRATDLALGDWTDFLTNATSPVTLPLEGAAGFYRVAGY